MLRRTALKTAALSLLPIGVLGRTPDATAADGGLVLVVAGDMNRLPNTRATGALAVQHQPDLVVTVGDQQYPDGSLADYRSTYDTTPWGRLKPITRPVPGHHEYDTPGARGYYAYFGVRPYYAYEIGLGWRGYALNSHIPKAEQVEWVRQDLAAHPGVRVVASWSDPRWSSGNHHGNEARMQPFLDTLAGRQGLVLNGHEHNYERFAVRNGLRQFVVGTGGSATYGFRGTPAPGSQKRIAHVPGILVLRLRSGGSYSWAFKNKAGRTLDSGSA